MADGSGTSYQDEELVSNLTTQAGTTVILYAQWTPLYNVMFDANGGSGVTTQVFTYGQSQKLNPNSFTRAGYRFICWNTMADGSGTSYQDEELVSNLTAQAGATVILYAQWVSDDVEAIKALSGEVTYKIEGTITAARISEINTAIKDNTSITGITLDLSAASLENNMLPYAAFQYNTQLKSITLPNTITFIDDAAFGGCSNLTEIVIPSGVTTIGGSAFNSCRSLHTITIPKSVTVIEDYTFEYCNSLVNVYYTGSLQDWNNISIDIENEELTNCNITYDYTP